MRAGVAIKSSVFKSIAVLIGEESAYRNIFADGTLTHTFLDLTIITATPSSIDGIVKEVRIILSDDAAGGITTWDSSTKKDMFLTRTLLVGKMIETRALCNPRNGIIRPGRVATD